MRRPATSSRIRAWLQLLRHRRAWWMTVRPIYSGPRIAEDGTARVAEDNTERVTEGASQP